MEKFLSIYCQHDNAAAVIADCLLQLEEIPSEYNFAFIYATDIISSDYPDLLQQCKKKTGIEHWIGTLGAGIIAPGKELYDQPAVSIMLAAFDVHEFAIFPRIQNINELKMVNWPKQFLTHFGIIHGDPFYQNTQNLITDLHQQVEESFLVGGLTSSKDKQYQVANDIFTQGVSGVFFSENIPVLTNLSQGCSPIGEKHKITHAEKNIIYTLNNKPALEELIKAFNISNFNELKNHAGDIFMGLCIPHSDQNDYVVRNLVGIDIEQKLFAINDIPTEGNELIFCEHNKNTAINDMQKMLDKIAGRLNGKPKGGVYISCLGRGRELLGQNSEEIKMIHNTLGDFPLTGFFANGEIHHHRLYGYTGVLTLFV